MASYDLAVIGGGPAGLAAAMYGGMRGLSTVIFEAEAFGGQLINLYPTKPVTNFPAYATIDSRDIALRLADQAERFGAGLFEWTPVEHVSRDGHDFVIRAGNGRSSASPRRRSAGRRRRRLECRPRSSRPSADPRPRHGPLHAAPPRAGRRVALRGQGTHLPAAADRRDRGAARGGGRRRRLSPRHGALAAHRGRGDDRPPPRGVQRLCLLAAAPRRGRHQARHERRDRRAGRVTTASSAWSIARTDGSTVRVSRPTCSW